MRVRMQKLNMVKYAHSDAEQKRLEQQGYAESPGREPGQPAAGKAGTVDAAEKPKGKGKAGKDAGREGAADG